MKHHLTPVSLLFNLYFNFVYIAKQINKLYTLYQNVNLMETHTLRKNTLMYS